MLGGSRRGGRRVKRSASDVANNNTQVPNIDSVIRTVPHPLPPPRSDHQDLDHRQHRLPSWSSLNPELRTLPPLGHDVPGPPMVKMTVDDTVAETDLQNPADALEFLAHVSHMNGKRHPYSRCQVPPTPSLRETTDPTDKKVCTQKTAIVCVRVHAQSM